MIYYINIRLICDDMIVLHGLYITKIVKNTDSLHPIYTMRLGLTCFHRGQ